MPDLHQKLIPAGPGHPRVRQYLDLKLNRHPVPGALPLEGLWLVRAAMQNDVPIEAAIVCTERLRGPGVGELVEELRATAVPVFQVGRRTFERLTNRDGPDGLVAIGRFRDSELARLGVGHRSLVLVLDRFEMAGNIGSLIRCGDAVGASAVILADCAVRMAHPVLLKASMGAVFSVPICRVSSESALAWLRRRGFRLVAADPGAPVSYREARYASRTAVVVGSERLGLSAGWRAAADELVSVPLRGRADSLNAGQAGAVVLYEVLHQQEDLHPFGDTQPDG